MNAAELDETGRSSMRVLKIWLFGRIWHPAKTFLAPPPAGTATACGVLAGPFAATVRTATSATTAPREKQDIGQLDCSLFPPGLLRLFSGYATFRSARALSTLAT